MIETEVISKYTMVKYFLNGKRYEQEIYIKLPKLKCI